MERKLSITIIVLFIIWFIIASFLLKRVSVERNELRAENNLMREICAPQVPDMQKQEVREVPPE